MILIRTRPPVGKYLSNKDLLITCRVAQRSYGLTKFEGIAIEYVAVRTNLNMVFQEAMKLANTLNNQVPSKFIMIFNNNGEKEFFQNMIHNNLIELLKVRGSEVNIISKRYL
jgi:hypothetical protein